MSRIRMVLVLVFLCEAAAFAVEPKDQFSALFITSTDPDQPGIGAVIEQARIEIQGAHPTHFDIEYLDPQLSSAGTQSDVNAAEYLQAKYRRHRFELIITIGPQALSFAENHGDQIFPGARILSVMLGPSQSAKERKPSAAVSTLYLEPDYTPTLEIALAQNPDTQQVVLIAGSAANDQQQLQWARANLAAYASRLQLHELTNYTFDQLKIKLGSLKPHSVALFVDFTADSTGEEYVNTRALTEFSHSANCPIYGNFREQVGSGAVGGSVLDLREAGRMIGKAGIQVLNGKEPEKALVLSGKQQRYVFDARQLKQWHIVHFPSESIVLNQESLAWTLHDPKFIILALALCLEALLIVFLFKATLRRKRVEHDLARLLALVRLESCLAASIISLPVGLVRMEINRGFSQFIELIGMDCISIYELQQKTSQFRLLCYSSIPRTKLRLSRLNPAEFERTADKLRGGQAVVIHAVSDTPQESPGVMRELSRSGLHSFAAFPIIVDQRVVGALVLSTARDPNWDAALLDELQAVANIVGSGLDRAMTHASLGRSEQLKSAILTSLPASVMVLDRKGCVVDFNSSVQITSFEGNFGPESVTIGTDYLKLCRQAAHQGSRQAQTALNGLQCVLKGSSGHFEIEYPWGAAPHQRWSRMSVVPLSTEQNGVVIVHTDVTERKLAALEREQLQTARSELSGRLLRAQEEERARLARELHDDINQKLGLLAVDIQTLQQRAPQTVREIHGALEELFKTTNGISSDIQHLSHELHSSRLDYLGLAAALPRLCAEFAQQHDIPIECVVTDMPEKLSREIGLCLFRVAQECLTNIAKHSSAAHVAVRLQCIGDTIRMSVSDDGRGFNPAKVGARKDPGLGLISMSERLRLVNGELILHSKENTGTRITATVPLRMMEDRSARLIATEMERKLA